MVHQPQRRHVAAHSATVTLPGCGAPPGSLPGRWPTPAKTKPGSGATPGGSGGRRCRGGGRRVGGSGRRHGGGDTSGGGGGGRSSLRLNGGGGGAISAAGRICVTKNHPPYAPISRPIAPVVRLESRTTFSRRVPPRSDSSSSSLSGVTTPLELRV